MADQLKTEKNRLPSFSYAACWKMLTEILQSSFKMLKLEKLSKESELPAKDVRTATWHVYMAFYVELLNAVIQFKIVVDEVQISLWG